MAQDFYAAFNVGEDDKHITQVDEGGVALAAIQGLYKLVQEQYTLLQAQQAEIRRSKRGSTHCNSDDSNVSRH